MPVTYAYVDIWIYFNNLVVFYINKLITKIYTIKAYMKTHECIKCFTHALHKLWNQNISQAVPMTASYRLGLVSWEHYTINKQHRLTLSVDYRTNSRFRTVSNKGGEIREGAIGDHVAQPQCQSRMFFFPFPQTIARKCFPRGGGLGSMGALISVGIVRINGSCCRLCCLFRSLQGASALPFASTVPSVRWARIRIVAKRRKYDHDMFCYGRSKKNCYIHSRLIEIQQLRQVWF